MIEINKLVNAEPYDLFKSFYDQALSKNQNNIEACAISSFSHNDKEVNSRFVNLKYIIDNNWIFFSNYKSAKSSQFISHNQVSALFFWNTINVQIRIKGLIYKCNKDFSDKHFLGRTKEKNALAISSNQSRQINSYDSVVSKYNMTLNKNGKLNKVRPDYWGGYYFIPYYFEFWEGHNSRLNKRDVYEIQGSKWDHFILQP